MYPSLPGKEPEKKEYPCDCSAMKYMMDHADVFRKEEGHWILAWIELDKTEKGTNIERFGMKFE